MKFVPLVSLPPIQRLAPGVPLIVRLAVGSVLIAHGFHFSPAEFAGLAEAELGAPFPSLVGWVVTVLLLGGGALLLVGFLSRLIALPLLLHLTLAIFLWDTREGFAPVSGAGVQIPLLVIAGLLTVLLSGPGPLSVDNALGWDNGWLRPSPERALRQRVA